MIANNITDPTQFDEFTIDSATLHTFPKERNRITVYQSNHGWSETIKEKLNELCSLEKGWDGYNALPVSFETAVFSLSMLDAIGEKHTPTPQIIPGVDGDLQIEWHLENGEIELHVRSPYDVIAWRNIEENSEDGEEVPLKTDYKIIVNWLKQLAE